MTRVKNRIAILGKRHRLIEASKAVLRFGHRITGNRKDQSNRRGRGQGLGWEALHVAIEDASPLAYTEILSDEKTSATAFSNARSSSSSGMA